MRPACHVYSLALSGPTSRDMAACMADAIRTPVTALLSLFTNTAIALALLLISTARASCCRALAAFLGLQWNPRYRGCDPHTLQKQGCGRRLRPQPTSRSGKAAATHAQTRKSSRNPPAGQEKLPQPPKWPGKAPATQAQTRKSSRNPPGGQEKLPQPRLKPGKAAATLHLARKSSRNPPRNLREVRLRPQPCFCSVLLPQPRK